MTGNLGKNSLTKALPASAATLAPIGSATPAPAKGQTAAPPPATPTRCPPATAKLSKTNGPDKGATLEEQGELRVKGDLIMNVNSPAQTEAAAN